MSPEHARLVQSSYKQVAALGEPAAALFYRRLFELDPGLPALFKGDLAEQGRKLLAMIATAVNGLDDLGVLVPALQALGARHRGYGVSNTDYDTVATALLWTLEQGLGPAFTPAVKDAWVAVYAVLADTMKQAPAA